MSATASTPFAYNLLELYRQHRDEVDVLTDQTSLFILAFTNEMKSADIDALAGDLSLSLTALRAKLAPLLRGQMMLDSKGILTVTALGRRVLIELGFIPPIPPGPAEPPKKPEPPTQPPRRRLVRRDVPQMAAQIPSVATKPAATPGWLWGIIAFFVTGLVLVGSLLVAIILWPQPTPPPPRTTPQAFFGADRTLLGPGDCTFLRWNVQGGDWVELDGRRVSFSDATQICPTRSTVYSLVVGGDVGANRDVQIVVETPTPPTVQVQISFDADRTSINQGECTLLRWNVQGGFSVQLDDQKVDHTGQQQVCPQQTTVYELAVDTGNAIERRAVTISVTAPAPPPSGALNGNVYRAADARPIPNAQIQISGGPSTTAPNGSYSFANLAPGDYTVSANADGYQAQTQSVTIVAGQTATINFALVKAPAATGTGITLRQQDCLDFEQGKYFPIPSGVEFYTCPSSADVQWWTSTLRTVNGASITNANPQGSAYEDCTNVVSTPSPGISKPQVTNYYCVITSSKGVAVVRIATVDPNAKFITFDWWLY